MLNKLQGYLRRRLPHRSIVYGLARAAFSRQRLPPGQLVRLEESEKADRAFILHHASRVGRIFKAIGWGELYICVVGLDVGRRLLRDCAGDLRPMTLDVSGLFPKGFLRQMQGDDHKRYRKALNRALAPGDPAGTTRTLEAIAVRALSDYAAGEGEHRNTADAYIATLSRIATEMMIFLFYGAESGAPAFDRLEAGYHKLGPHGLVWNVTDQQREAYAEIRDFLRLALFTPASERSPEIQRSVLGRVAQDEVPDEAMLGNLIYMVETGRYDTHALLRWLTKHATECPHLLARIAEEDRQGVPVAKSFTEAFVLETLRMDQSERLMRRVQRDFVFEGFLIPKYATVRVCLWESHKSPEVFPLPFDFDPQRFVANPPTSEQFAPFGLDHHRCPFGDMSLRMCAAFLRALARNHTVTTLADGRPVRGAYHWEPAANFGIRLQPRAA